jgi:multiple sugar transport system ATP-binding protein
MTVFKNMAFALELRRMPKAEINDRVHEAAKIIDIEHLLDRKPRMLSGGERQRVALGRAMVRNPAVFLLDEPLSNLDAKLRASMRTELIKLHQRLETTFVYVTHDQTEAMTMGDRIVVLNKGVIQQVDSPQVLYDSPSNMFVAGFIGSPQMNFMDVMLESDDKGLMLVVNDDKLRLPKTRTNDKLKGYIGKTIKMGIRPEDISEGIKGDTVVDVKVEVNELMGNEVYLYLNYNDLHLTSRVPPTLTRTGDEIKVTFNMDKVHMFDLETEESLLI